MLVSSSSSAMGSSKFVCREFKKRDDGTFRRTEAVLSVTGRYRVPESELSLAHPGESCGENVSVSGEDGPHRPDPVVRSQTFLRETDCDQI